MNHCLLMMGGVGSRFGADRPKQYVDIDGRPVFIYILNCPNYPAWIRLLLCQMKSGLILCMTR